MRLNISLRLLFALALLISPCDAQMTLTGAGGTNAPAPAFSLTFQSSNSSNATTTTVDFGTLTYGAGNTRVVAAVGYRSATPSVTGVSIGGSACVGGTALAHISGTAGNPNADAVDMWESSASLAGASGDVCVTFGAAPAPSIIGSAVALYKLVTTTPTATGPPTTAFQASGASNSVTLTVPSGGGAVVVISDENAHFSSASNFTVDSNFSNQVVFGHTTTTGSTTPTANFSAADASNMSAAAWGP